MRETIRTFLAANCAAIPTWYQPFTPTLDTVKPYGVVKFEAPIPINKAAYKKMVSLWLYVVKGDFQPLDDIESVLIPLVEGHVFEVPATGAQFVLEHTFSGPDAEDDELNAFVRRLEFVIPLAK